MQDARHMALLRELASLHCLCEHCFQLTSDGHGKLKEFTENSALHWSRAFEWPWALINGEIEAGNRCLDVGGGHAVFQYVAARCCQPGEYLNVDSNSESHDAVHKMKQKLGLANIQELNGKLPDGWSHWGSTAVNKGESDSFDRVFCISVVEHCRNWREVLLDCARVLKPGGLLVVTMDVNSAGLANSKEFFIDRTDVRLLGGDIPEPPANALGTAMPDGAKLNCLCLKLQK
jgi:SAM-dependent methyltransferase